MAYLLSVTENSQKNQDDWIFRRGRSIFDADTPQRGQYCTPIHIQDTPYRRLVTKCG